MKSPIVSAAAVLGLMSASAWGQLGPLVISGHVRSNTLESGRFFDAQPGEPVRMTFSVLPGGFDPFWGPTGHFSPVDESSFELHVGTGNSDRVCYSAASGSSLVFINSGFVTTVVHQDEMEFFQMALDSSLYRVYFKVIDADDAVWSSPLVANLPHSTPASAFETRRWEVTDLNNPNMRPDAPTLTIDFDGAIVVPCRADINGDEQVSVQDIFDFLVLWFGATPGGDFNRDGTDTVQDIFDFLAVWFRGC